MKISEVAERTGVPASTLRYYERLGVLTASRSANGYRDFGDEHLERLDFIASAKRLGLELPEIRRLLDLADDGTCTGVKQTLQPLLAEQIAAVEEQLEALSRLQGQLKQARTHVDGCPDSDEPCRSECAFRAFAKTTPTNRGAQG
ncbi:MerR family transcriptional regulator [Brevibacterium sp. K11IcPPYGO002]|uniref:MerR family transcriptional regulator n=1 Tax=Brevibacterium sp. K11IcPPYGO002 TaxID=3058837 RepID=UPI003D81C4BC